MKLFFHLKSLHENWRNIGLHSHLLQVIKIWNTEIEGNISH